MRVPSGSTLLFAATTPLCGKVPAVVTPNVEYAVAYWIAFKSATEVPGIRGDAGLVSG